MGVLLGRELARAEAVTGLIRRTAALLAGHGFVVAVPEIYHELEPPGAEIPYDQAGAERGNAHKVAKEVAAYDADARAALDSLSAHSACTGRIGAMGICIGGHLAFRAAMNPEVVAAACFYATDIDNGTLGKGMQDNSLERAGEIQGELLHVWGRQDPHVPFEGRTLIRARLEEAGVRYQWHEVNGRVPARRGAALRSGVGVSVLRGCVRVVSPAPGRWRIVIRTSSFRGRAGRLPCGFVIPSIHARAGRAAWRERDRLTYLREALELAGARGATSERSDASRCRARRERGHRRAMASLILNL